MNNSDAEIKANGLAFRISLRTWMGVFTVTIVFLGFWTARATKQRNIANSLAFSGARMTYRYQYNNFDDEERFSANYNAEPPWLAKYVGIDYCSPIVRVTSIGADNPSEIAQLCSQLPRLRLLTIQDANLQAVDLKWVSGLRQLRGLYLAGTPIGDEAVPYLDVLSWLHVLNVRGTNLSPEAIGLLEVALPTAKVHAGMRTR